jgi:hypothetical protein
MLFNFFMSPRATSNPEFPPSASSVTVNRMTGKIPIEVTPPIAYSQIQMFDQLCSLQWHLSREYAPPFVPAGAIFGEAFHAGVKSYYRARLAGRVAKLDDLLGAYHFQWTSALSTGKPPVRFTDQWEDYDAMLILAEQLFEVFLASAHPSVVIAVDEPFAVTLAPDLPPVVGRIDLLEIRPDGDGRRWLHMVDFKLAARRSIKDDLDLDLFSLYLLAAKQAGWVDSLGLPLALRFNIVFKQRVLELMSAPVTRQGIDHLVGKVRHCDRYMKEGISYPTSSLACAACSFAAQCREWPHLPTLNAV